MKSKILLFAMLISSGCLKEEALNLEFDSFQPKEINDGLILSKPEDEGMDIEKLISVYASVYEDENLWSLRSMLVFRNKKLVAESYLKDEEDIINRHLIWSSTKQVMGIIAGIAIDQGLINSVNDPISDYLTEIFPNHADKAQITISHLLTMQSGIDYNNDGVGGETDKVLRQLPDNITEFVLSRPMRAEPGTEFFYNDGDPQLISAIIQAVAGEPTDSWADKSFFSRIGVSNYKWLRYKDGTTLGGYGIETTPRELGKIALCVADSGRYNNQLIVSSDWIVEMTAKKAEEDIEYDFGYYWWYDSSRNIHFTWGHGGQFAFIIPNENLIVVMTSIPNTQGKYQILADEALPVVDKIVSACY